jgi:nitroreductase
MKDHRREAYAVSAGQRRYEQDHSEGATSFYLLRRNIHRLEKGLIMRPRRPAFAADYILPTAQVFRRARSVEAFDIEELRWAEDVLRQYFSVVDASHPKIGSAKMIFEDSVGELGQCSGAIPYKRNLADIPIAPNAFFELCMRRRSVRWYQQKQVSRSLIDEALMAARQAPSACNRQPFIFRVFDQEEDAHRLCSLALGTKGFAHQVPAAAAIVGRLRAYPLSRDRHAIYIDGALAAMSFMFALECQGIASCPINWPDQEPQETSIRDELGLDEDERVIMLIAFGWPDPEGLVPFSAKKGLEQLRRFG